MLLWIYLDIIKPLVTYRSLVWWSKMQEKQRPSLLQYIQQLVFVGTCPTAAMEPGLHLIFLHHSTILSKLEKLVQILRELRKLVNLTNHVSNFDKQFGVAIKDRQKWKPGKPKLHQSFLWWCTDPRLMQKLKWTSKSQDVRFRYLASENMY